jgi:hypothetical protein
MKIPEVSVKKTERRLSEKRILRKRVFFLPFLSETGFPNPKRIGERGPEFKYPERLIMFIAVLSVKLKIKSYVRIHKMSEEYRDVISEGPELKPISERQLRDRLKKIRHHSGKAAASVFQIFPELKQTERDKCG